MSCNNLYSIRTQAPFPSSNPEPIDISPRTPPQTLCLSPMYVPTSLAPYVLRSFQGPQLPAAPPPSSQGPWESFLTCVLHPCPLSEPFQISPLMKVFHRDLTPAPSICSGHPGLPLGHLHWASACAVFSACFLGSDSPVPPGSLPQLHLLSGTDLPNAEGPVSKQGLHRSGGIQQPVR